MSLLNQIIGAGFEGEKAIEEKIGEMTAPTPTSGRPT